MNKWSRHSLEQLMTCDARVRQVMIAILPLVDIRILEGHRDEARQNLMADTGKSQLRWPHGAHNKRPSLGWDCITCPIDWADREQHIYVAGLIVATASGMGIEVVWGGDWNRNFRVAPEPGDSWDDLCHFQIKE